jgi:uncharacterized protein (DUF934 family)
MPVIALDDAQTADAAFAPPGDAPAAGPLALELEATTAAAGLAPLLPRAQAIRIRFGGFADGRGLTLGRQLRLMGFAGRMRAAGPLLPDQRAALRGCGFDEVELEAGHLARTGGAVGWTAPAAPPPFAARRAAAQA